MRILGLVIICKLMDKHIFIMGNECNLSAVNFFPRNLKSVFEWIHFSGQN